MLRPSMMKLPAYIRPAGVVSVVFTNFLQGIVQEKLPGNRKQKTGNRRQETEDRNQKTGNRRQETEDRK